MKAEYTDPYLKVHAQAIEYADRDTTEIRQVAFAGEGKKGSSIYRVLQPGGSVFVAVAGRCTVVFGDRGPVGFERTLGPHSHVEGKDECAGWFLRHMSSKERHECFYVEDAIAHCVDMSDPEDNSERWDEVKEQLISNRYEMHPDLWFRLLEDAGIELCDNAQAPMKPDFDAVFCAQICVQIERWLLKQETERNR